MNKVTAVLSKKEAILILLLLTCFTFFVQWTGAEQRSFFSLVLALSHDQSVCVDRYAHLTADKAYYDGHYYSDKAPGLPFLGWPFYMLFNAMQGLARPGLFLPYSVYMVSAFAVSLPSALLFLLVLRFLLRLRFSETHSYATTLALALGTLAFPFSTLFFSHQTAAFFIFAAFYAVFLAVPEQGVRQLRLIFLAGLSAGAAVVTEYPLAIAALFLGVYALARLRDKRRVLWYILGGLPCAMFLLIYNTVAFDHPLHFSYFYTVNTWAQVHQQGFLGLSWPRLDTLITVLFGARGLWTLSPVLILAVPGFWLMLRPALWRSEGMLFLVTVVVYLLMTSGYLVPPTDIWVPGPRFLLPVLPFLAAPLAFAVRRWPWVFAPLAVISTGIMLLVTAVNPQVPPEVDNPLLQYWLPGLLDRSQLVHTLPGLRFGISRGFSLLLLLVALLLYGGAWLAIWLTRHDERLQSRLVSLTLALALIAYLVLSFPIDLRRPFDVPRSLLPPTAHACPVCADVGLAFVSSGGNHET